MYQCSSLGLSCLGLRASWTWLTISLPMLGIHTCSLLSHVQLIATPWTVVCQAPLSMEFSRQEYWSGWPFPSPGDLPNPGIEPRSLHCRQILCHVFMVSFQLLFLQIFSWILSLSLPSGTPIMWMQVHLMLSQRSLRLSSFFFSFFFYIVCYAAVISTILSSRWLICSSASVILLLIPSNVLFISVCLFFNPSRSLVNIYCIFSIFAFILYPRFWIIFTSIMNFFGRLPISTSFGCFPGVLSCPFIWNKNPLLFHPG